MDTQPFQAILESLKNFTRVEGAGGGRLCLALNCMVHDNYYHASDASSASELLITAFILHSISTQSQRKYGRTETECREFGILLLSFFSFATHARIVDPLTTHTPAVENRLLTQKAHSTASSS